MSLSLPESVNALLTEAECAEIDQTLLPTRERFSIRLKVYAARYLTQMARRLNTPVEHLTADQIMGQLESDPSLQKDGMLEAPFAEWFANLLNASLKPLTEMAADCDVSVEGLTLEQIIQWHRQQLDADLPN